MFRRKMLFCKGRTLLHSVVCPLSWSGSLSSATMKPRNCVSRGTQCCTLAGVRVPTEEFAAVRHSTVKRKVAVHFGYVGTGFRGMYHFICATAVLAMRCVRSGVHASPQKTALLEADLCTAESDLPQACSSSATAAMIRP